MKSADCDEQSAFFVYIRTMIKNMIKLGKKIEKLENSYTTEGGTLDEEKKRDSCYVFNSDYGS